LKQRPRAISEIIIGRLRLREKRTVVRGNPIFVVRGSSVIW
jgi:hypothetical protein